MKLAFLNTKYIKNHKEKRSPKLLDDSLDLLALSAFSGDVEPSVNEIPFEGLSARRN